MPEYFTDGIEISSDDSDREGSNEENSDKENAKWRKLNTECVYFYI